MWQPDLHHTFTVRRVFPPHERREKTAVAARPVGWQVVSVSPVSACWGQSLLKIFCLSWQFFRLRRTFLCLLLGSWSFGATPAPCVHSDGLHLLINRCCFLTLNLCFFCFSSKEITLTENSRVFEGWKNPPPPVYMEYYFFNVTNPEVFLAGGKAAVKQIGPYTYR